MEKEINRQKRNSIKFRSTENYSTKLNSKHNKLNSSENNCQNSKRRHLQTFRMFKDDYSKDYDIWNQSALLFCSYFSNLKIFLYARR